MDQENNKHFITLLFCVSCCSIPAQKRNCLLWLIVFTDENYSGLLPASKIVTKSYILYVCRVLHPPSKITVTGNSMQGSIRDFFISNVKNIPQNKAIMWYVAKKQWKPRTLSWQKAICNGEKGLHECIGFGIFWCAQE